MQTRLFDPPGPRRGQREEGYLVIGMLVIPVWRRAIAGFCTVVLRQEGGAGRRMGDLEAFLSGHDKDLHALLRGEVVTVDHDAPRAPRPAGMDRSEIIMGVGR